VTVFVSHSTKDRPFVESHLIPFLQSSGIQAWYSKRSIASGSEWEHSIRSGLEGSEWVVVVVSANAIGSEWVRCEVDWALENRPSRLVPLLIDQVRPDQLHLRLRLIQAVDWASSPSQAQELLLAMWGVPPDQHKRPAATPADELKFDDYLYARPKNWHCIFCGWRCDEDFNDYICKQCGKLRPFAGGSATMIKCKACEGFSLALARFCEWCGASIGA
jgi:hypothetical protein